MDTIESIGPTYARRLALANIVNTEQLLQEASTQNGRLSLAAETDVPESLILKWVNHADLMRIKGIGGEFAELLEASGVGSLVELRKRTARALLSSLRETNEKKRLTRMIPSTAKVESWIEQAKQLEPRVVQRMD
ncbi:MAG: DUF4332 domain-containing protein [Myxococcota bacterium]